MTTYSLNALTNRMKGKSVTLGWDAVVFMNRAKVNSLLEQQYITRFKHDSFLKRIFGAPSMVPDDSEYLEMSGLILSHPRLSFEEASLRDSKVTATMDIVSGTVSYIRKGSNQVPGAILYSYVVSANQGYTLTMNIDLAASRGTVNEQGRVIVDIGDGYNCRCNLVTEDRAQQTLGDFFKALFLEQKPEDRVYELGMLDLRDVDLLAPRSFQIRTMATDEGKNRASDDYGEGAVVLLVRTKGNPKEGDDPSEGSLDYLIPDDRDSQTGKALYSGSLVLASRVVFDWYVREAIERQIGGNLRLRSSESDHLSRKLSAIAGGFEIPGFRYVWQKTLISETSLSNSGPLIFKLTDPSPENTLQVSANGDDGIELSLQGPRLMPFHLRMWQWAFGTDNWYWDAITTAHVHLKFSPVFSSLPNYVTFEQIADPIIEFNGIWDPNNELDNVGSYPELPGMLHAALQPAFLQALRVFRTLELPGLNALAISNVLFPERNALQLSEARLPGDLLMVGHIDPKETTFTLDPLLPVVKAGDKQKFEIRQLGYRSSDVQWSVRSVDGSRGQGSIDSSGEYEAPEASRLEGSAIRNVVTATYTDSATGKEVTASALVVVVLTSVVVTPSMSLIPMSDRRDVRLKATSLGAGPFRWTPRSNVGSLQANGAEAVYTPPSSDLPDGALEAVLIDVEDISTGEKAVATVLLRQGNFALNVSPALHPGLRPNGTALLKLPSPQRPEQFTWEVVAGEGSIDGQTGLFTAPSTITLPYSVVKISYADEFFDHLGYSIIHLSEHARQSEWHSLDIFDFEISARPPTVYANGLQQAKVVVRVKPTGDAELSESEYESIRLVTAEQKIPLPEVGEDGVPEGNKWYYTETENNYDPYPHPALSQEVLPNRPKGLMVKEFFVQCHKIEDLRVAAMLRSDNYETIYSNPGSEGEADRKVINLTAVEPPDAGTIGAVVLTFGEPGGDWPKRVEGDADDENDLTTLDYYYLKLLINQRQVAIKKVQFVGNSSMVKWESDTMLEDIHSITGYAVADEKNDQGKIILHTDEILKRRLIGQLNAPEETVRNDDVPIGEVLFSLQRREYWRYDSYAKSDFDKALDVIVFDRYGNRHRVKIGFDGNNRNKLAIIK